MHRIEAAVALTLFAVAVSACGSTRASANGAPAKTVTLPVRDAVYDVPSASMEPTLRCAEPNPGCAGSVSDKIDVHRHGRPLRRGDIIVFRTPPLAAVRCGTGGTFVKRVVGLPHERIEERAGFVYVNGKALAEPYVKDERRDSFTMRPMTVPPHSYFVAGDNRRHSCDSRMWGAVPAADVIGRVTRILRPH